MLLSKGLAIILAFCNGFPRESFTVPVRFWEREKIGKNSNRISDFGI
jgi:hypothetical protein